jgi:hypothetical protein
MRCPICNGTTVMSRSTGRFAGLLAELDISCRACNGRGAVPNDFDAAEWWRQWEAAVDAAEKPD